MEIITDDIINDINELEPSDECPECGTTLIIHREGLTESAECPGCGYMEAQHDNN